jgi:hypothetical protein
MSDRWTPRPDLTQGSDDEKVESIIKWFRENYESPAERTPYETAEGGYQYIWGGPYEAREVLEDVFNGAPETIIDRAVNEIETEEDEWVPTPHEDDYK